MKKPSRVLIPLSASQSAGVASIIKALQMFQKQKIPPLAGMPAALNPKLPNLSELEIKIPCDATDFKPRAVTSRVRGGPSKMRPRRIVVNTFDAAVSRT